MLETFEISSFGVSLGYIFITALILKTLRAVMLQVVTSKFQQSLWLEFFATFELLATCFELGVVIEKHGFLAYSCLMLILFNYWQKAWLQASVAPHVEILNIIQRKTNLKTSLLKILFQVLAATLVYTFYVKPIWNIGYRSTHLQRVRDSRCFTHLQVPVSVGILVETLATLSFKVGLEIFGPKNYSYISLPLILVSIVYTGLTYTGCYFNPILATTIQFGCEGIFWMDHFLVYWVGPMLGTLLFDNLAYKLINKNSSLENNNKKIKQG